MRRVDLSSSAQPYGKVGSSRDHFNGQSIRFVIEGVILDVAFAYFFYRSIWATLLFIPLIVVYYKAREKEQRDKRLWELGLQFKEALGFVCANLQAGYSMENAFRETYIEICSMFGRESGIVKEWFLIVSGLKSNRTLEVLLLEFAKRSNVSDIEDFAEIFSMAKRNGGDFTTMVTACSESISGKMETQREIRVAVSEKKLEYRIMCAVPFLILGYINFTSPGFFDPLYHNLMGVSIMTVCLGIYLMAVWLGQRITDIRVHR